MSDVLKLAAERAASKTTTELRPMGESVSVTVGGTGCKLALAEVPGDIVLIREHEVGKLGKADAEGKQKRSRDNGTELVWKRSASLADFGAALGAGLLD